MQSSKRSMPDAGSTSLVGLGVLVTRPVHQSKALCELIRAAGGHAIRFPALEIRGPSDPGSVRALLERLGDYQLAIFVSANAVRYGLEMVQVAGVSLRELELAAVGRPTARALTAAGFELGAVPDGRYDSEALLAHPRLQQVAGQRIVIFRGQGGRALLGETLCLRGAEVAYAEVYRRVCPTSNPDDVLARWSDIEVVTATSNEALDNLVHLLGEANLTRLQQTPLLVISERMARHAAALGFRQVQCTERAGDEAIVAALIKYNKAQIDTRNKK